MSSPTQWTWVWTNSERWWRTRKPSMLQSEVSKSRTRFNDWTHTPNLGQSYQAGEVIPNAWKCLCHPPSVVRENDTGQSQRDQMFSCYSLPSVSGHSSHCLFQLSYLVWWFSYLQIKTWYLIYISAPTEHLLGYVSVFRYSCQWLSVKECFLSPKPVPPLWYSVISIFSKSCIVLFFLQFWPLYSFLCFLSSTSSVLEFLHSLLAGLLDWSLILIHLAFCWKARLPEIPVLCSKSVIIFLFSLTLRLFLFGFSSFL